MLYARTKLIMDDESLAGPSFTFTLLHRLPNKMKVMLTKILVSLVVLGLTFLAVWYIHNWLSVEVPCRPADRVVLKRDQFLHQTNPIFAGLNPEEWRQLIHAHVNSLSIIPESKIFDSGCGSGAFLDVLARDYAAEITGIDLDHKLIKLAKSKMNGTFIQADPRNLSFFPPEHYDYVFSFNFFQYFKTKKDARMALFQLSRLAKPNAKMMIGFVNDFHYWTAEMDSEECEQNIFLDRAFWKDVCWEFGLVDLKIIPERSIERGWFNKVESSWYQYTVYMRKAGIVHG